MIIIKKARQEDVQQIKDLLSLTWLDTYKNIMPEFLIKKITSTWHSLENLKAQIDYKTVIFNIAEENETLVGIITAKNNGEGEYYLNRLYVLPNNQGKGIGRDLLNNFMELPDVKKVTLEVEEDNANAIKFYNNAGFKEVDRKIENIDGFTLKTVVMQKN